jgi:predicted DNA-binding transcriptional regulator YafY
MPVNKLALIRYKTIDRCLQNRYRKWTLDNLVEAVSEAVYEFEGIRRGISRRTLQLDLQNMRSEKMGFSAPIVVVDKKYYTYEDKGYSINNTPISNYDLEKLGEAASLLRQLKGFSYFSDLSAMAAKLEDKILKNTKEGVSYIELDKNEQLKGLEFIEPIHVAIRKKTALLLEYQSFKAKSSHEQIFFPYLLKEYNNRWFVLGSFQRDGALKLLALDRINALREEATVAWRPAPANIFRYFEDVIGVSKTPKQRAISIVLKVQKTQLPYFTTKPLHSSQQIIGEEDGWVKLVIRVVWNFELEREILGMGEVVKVVAPRRLREKIGLRLRGALGQYEQREKG